MIEPAIRLAGVTKDYAQRDRPSWQLLLLRDDHRLLDDGSFRALDHVDLEVAPGSAIGLVGRNGAGKSTIMRLVAGTVRPTHGTVEVRGRVASVLTLGAGFDDDLTGADNLWFAADLSNVPRSILRRNLAEIVAFSGIERYLDVPVGRYSTGMRARLALALMLHTEAPIILIDEVLSVGDWSFRKAALARLRDLNRAGTTVVFVSHDQWAITQVCDEVAWIDHGRLAERGRPSDVIAHYLGDYVVDDLVDRPAPPLSLAEEPMDPTRVLLDLVVPEPDIEPWSDLGFELEVASSEPGPVHLLTSVSAVGRVGFLDNDPGPLLDGPGTWTLDGSIRSVALAPGEYLLRVIARLEPADGDPELLAVAQAVFTVAGAVTATPGVDVRGTFTSELVAGSDR